MNKADNFTPQNRAKEVSKQEEIILRKISEIKNQTKLAKPNKEKPDFQSKNSPNNLDSTTANTKPQPRLPDGECRNNLSNKFANDGSFFEQFKKLAKKIPEPSLKPRHSLFSEEDATGHRSYNQTSPPLNDDQISNIDQTYSNNNQKYNRETSLNLDNRETFSNLDNNQKYNRETSSNVDNSRSFNRDTSSSGSSQKSNNKQMFSSIVDRALQEQDYATHAFYSQEATRPTQVPSRPNTINKIQNSNSSTEVTELSTADQSKWFQEALKKAREKAMELNGAVYLSVDGAQNQQDHEDDIKKRSRWGGGSNTSQSLPPSTPVLSDGGGGGLSSFNIPPTIMCMVGEGQHMEAIQGVMVTKLTRSNPAIIAYAKQVFGSLDLSDAQWKQCEEQMKMNVVFQLLQQKKKESERLEQQGRVKYEYDSDEEVDGGTWEHKRRKIEMGETWTKSEELTKQAEGKHHIGDFLPPEELAKFIEKFHALNEGRDPDLSDYQDNKLTEDNVGYRMLKSMGWMEGSGLGAEGRGITTPVNQQGRTENAALGVDRADQLTNDDDEYGAYRKRMMLSYRFRPNPMNNPRRNYY